MKILIIIPTYNEKENIKNLVYFILSLKEKLDVLIVDDNSPDGTGVVADEISRENKNIFVIRRPQKQGLGRAYVEGFKFALKNQYDIAVQMDADFSHDPAHIKNFLIAIETNDLVIGSRYLRGINILHWPLKRLIISKLGNFYARTILRIPLTDFTSGYKCISKRVLQKIDLDSIHSSGYSFQIEFNFLAYKAGFKIKEIEIIFTERSEGKSKMSKKIAWEAAWIVLGLKLKELASLFAKI